MFERFKTASPSQQLWLAIVGIAILAIALFLLWFFLFRTTYRPLFTQLKTNDASTIVDVLTRKKIPYRLADGGATILVPSDLADRARLDVMGGDVPLKGTVGFELFNKADMGLTDFAQKINYQRALQGELERTIMTLDGVDTVRVHLSMGEDRLFRDDQSPPKASITIRMTKGSFLSETVAQGVRRLVAAAVSKLNANDVVILDEHGRAVQAIEAGVVSNQSAFPLLDEQRAVEEFYRSRIRRTLHDAGFPSTISVSVAAEANAIATGEPIIADWSPAMRNFPLRVTLSTVIPLDAVEQDRARELIRSAVGGTPTKNDQILFDRSSEVLEPPKVNATPWSGSVPRRSDANISSSEGEPYAEFDWLLMAIPLIVVLLAGLLLIRKLRGPRRLSAQSRSEFVDRIRVALEERDNHATSKP